MLFSEDQTVVPKESAWFGSYAPKDEGSGDEATLIPMRLQDLYTEDRIGLKTLDEKGAVVLKTCEGEHMQITKDCWEPLVKEFVGGTNHHDAILRVQG